MLISHTSVAIHLVDLFSLLLLLFILIPILVETLCSCIVPHLYTLSHIAYIVMYAMCLNWFLMKVVVLHLCFFWYEVYIIVYKYILYVFHPSKMNDYFLEQYFVCNSHFVSINFLCLRNHVVYICAHLPIFIFVKKSF